MLKHLRAWFMPSAPIDTETQTTAVAQQWSHYLPFFALFNQQGQTLGNPPMYGDIPVPLLPNVRILWETEAADAPIHALSLRFGTYCRANDCHVSVVIAGHNYRFHAQDWEDNASVTLTLPEPLTLPAGERFSIEVYSDDTSLEKDAVVALWCSAQPPTFIQQLPEQTRLGFKIDKPRVSIVIPVFNKALYTYNCLLTLQQCDTDIAQEIIVVDLPWNGDSL